MQLDKPFRGGKHTAIQEGVMNLKQGVLLLLPVLIEKKPIIRTLCQKELLFHKKIMGPRLRFWYEQYAF